MKQGDTLQNVLKQLQYESEHKRDFISPASALVLEDDGKTLRLQGEGINTTDLFQRQLASALNIPAKYADLMRKEMPSLLATNVNSWLHTRDANYMIRTMDGQLARAFLSDRYRRIDNLEVAMAVLPVFMGDEQFEVVSSAVTNARLYLKLSFHQKKYEIKPGDWVEFGCIVSNSEVGLGAVTVKPFLNRLVCTNGMVCNSLGERRHHVGRQAKALEDSFELYSDSTIEAEDRAFLLKLQDVAKATLDESRYPLIVSTLQEAAEAPITGRVQDVMELTAKTFGFSSSESDSILDYLIRGGDMTLYGLSNAVTQASQGIESYDRATEMESLGWDIVSMDARQWREMNR